MKGMMTILAGRWGWHPDQGASFRTGHWPGGPRAWGQCTARDVPATGAAQL